MLQAKLMGTTSEYKRWKQQLWEMQEHHSGRIHYPQTFIKQREKKLFEKGWQTSLEKQREIASQAFFPSYSALVYLVFFVGVVFEVSPLLSNYKALPALLFTSPEK